MRMKQCRIPSFSTPKLTLGVWGKKNTTINILKNLIPISMIPKPMPE
jgi:hypothetical protein